MKEEKEERRAEEDVIDLLYERGTFNLRGNKSFARKKCFFFFSQIGFETNPIIDKYINK